jgi:hypothetical protein
MIGDLVIEIEATEPAIGKPQVCLPIGRKIGPSVILAVVIQTLGCPLCVYGSLFGSRFRADGADEPSQPVTPRPTKGVAPFVARAAPRVAYECPALDERGWSRVLRAYQGRMTWDRAHQRGGTRRTTGARPGGPGMPSP